MRAAPRCDRMLASSARKTLSSMSAVIRSAILSSRVKTPPVVSSVRSRADKDAFMAVNNSSAEALELTNNLHQWDASAGPCCVQIDLRPKDARASCEGSAATCD